jgi:hypothetical protein
MDLIDLNNGSIIKLKEFLKNLRKSLISINLIRARYIKFFTKTINILNRSK